MKAKILFSGIILALLVSCSGEKPNYAASRQFAEGSMQAFNNGDTNLLKSTYYDEEILKHVSLTKKITYYREQYGNMISYTITDSVATVKSGKPTMVTIHYTVKYEKANVSEGFQVTAKDNTFKITQSTQVDY